MAVLGLILKLVGIVVFLAGWWSAIRELFGENRALGYLGFAVPVFPLIWTVIHWDDLKRECLLQITGVALIAAGVFFFPSMDSLT